MHPASSKSMQNESCDHDSIEEVKMCIWLPLGGPLKKGATCALKHHKKCHTNSERGQYNEPDQDSAGVLRVLENAPR